MAPVPLPLVYETLLVLSASIGQLLPHLGGVGVGYKMEKEKNLSDSN